MPLRHHVENSGVCQVAIKSGVECSLERRSLGIGAHRLEVCRCDTNPLIAKVGAGVDPVLRVQEGSHASNENKGGER